MKRLIVCADGTWNSRDDASESGEGLTNVARLARLIAPVDAQGVRQEHVYLTGVGVERSALKRWLGGATGWGLSDNVLEAYAWLIERFEPHDELYLFGFSRGAFTARSLAGLIRNSGLLRREHVGRLREAYELYRDRAPATHPSAQRSVDFRAAYAHETPIHVLGVWDTVGSLGVPTSGPVGWYTRHRYGFHDVALSSRVRNAFHALAIDEHRKPFAPTLWEVQEAERVRAGQRVEQVWFAGAHCDVGGGYAECGLSDGALAWMIARAAECGLAFRDRCEAELRADCHGPVHDSMSAMYRVFGRHLRPIAERRLTTAGPVETYESVSPSVLERMRRATDYAPENLKRYLASVGAGAGGAGGAHVAQTGVPVPPPA
ncbi:MAG TPA: DUF2235 domain-containing protein [Gemmatimonadaceae bacterium]|nr:DUF2235 domain-containing protein [Gemmatimonadaceae bacterium]